ncbi:MAG: HEAT repeat domain-containing protein [Anaerolineae bacterium]|nr:HEAT repeat domain-containing protein [Anaerolineae bacterium]
MIELRETLDLLRSGTLSRASLYALSNLSRKESGTAWAVCAGLPVALRDKLVRQLVEIAEDDFQVNFGEIFRRALEDESAAVRLAAVEGLWEDEDVRLVGLLAPRLLEETDAAVRAAAADSLGRFVLLGELGKIREQPHRAALRALLAAAAVPEEVISVRRRIVESLAYSGEEAVADLIQRAYQDPSEEMRTSAVFAMGRSADERWSAVVLSEMFAPNPAMRYEAARACGELELEDAVLSLIDLVEDVDVEVQQAAIWSLGQIGGEEARRTLKNCCHSDNEAIRSAAQEALCELEFLQGNLGMFFTDDDFDEGEYW